MDDRQKRRVIDELNGFLKGRFMGIRQYERLIERANDPELKDMLRRFRDHAELGAEKIARRIRELGGEPVDGPGLMGEMQLWMQKFGDAPEDVRDILRDALVGENKYGIRFSHKNGGRGAGPGKQKRGGHGAGGRPETGGRTAAKAGGDGAGLMPPAAYVLFCIRAIC